MTTDEAAFEILRSIRRILRKVSEHSRRLSRQSGLTVPQLLCLRAIGEIDGNQEATVASISQAVQLSPPTVSRILDRLEDAGYIVRERRSGDRRKVCLSLTPAGEELIQRQPAPLHEEFLARLASLQHDERALLRRSLEQIVELMEAADIDAAPILAPGDVKQPELE